MILSRYADGLSLLDIDWEYPAGNGADYRKVPNSKKTYEIKGFPKLLKAVKKAITPKPLSIAVAGLERDMIAFYGNPTPQEIWDTVDFVNIMTYDLINRRDTATQHHTRKSHLLMARSGDASGLLCDQWMCIYHFSLVCHQSYAPPFTIHVLMSTTNLVLI